MKTTEIVIISRFGSKICEPFVINKAPEDNSEEKENTNSPSTISDNQEETEVTEESC